MRYNESIKLLLGSQDAFNVPVALELTLTGAVLPTAYPYLLFKGITTYGWPTGFWFFHGVLDKIKHVTNFKASQAMVLNAMGYDDNDGKITFHKDMNRICFSPPNDPLLPRKLNAFQKFTKKLGGILFISRYRSTSVHHLGGCNASSDHLCGVCNPSGQVFDPEGPATVHAGLYVCDASLIPCSVGINPSLTIATAAEYVSKHLVRDVLMYKNNNDIEIPVKTDHQSPHSTPEKNTRGDWRSMVIFKETMRGYIGAFLLTPCESTS
ncbi:hypothetical protein F2P56_010145 [Juglans regia]|uniref:Cholesterol oxidase n=1 Tax=Juglans regia TaxID=51240 RepID=A0A833XVW1_JUGRE|nr:hypothetical protein F2P56_010145 [Juglans regia]